MKRHSFLFFTVIFCGVARSALTQEVEIFDLAALSPGSEIEQTVPPGTVLQVKVINRVPKFTYKRTASVESIPIATFADLVPRTVRAAPENCDEVITDLSTALAAADTEDAVASAVRSARESGATLCRGGDADELEDLIEQKTTYTFRRVVLSLGERLVVEVSRVEGDETLLWKTTYTTGPRGRWLTTYGVGFLPIRDEEFFTQSLGDDKFEIRAKDSSGGLDFVPAIFFTWLPRKWENKSWAFSPAGGLGFDVSKPVVFLGGAAIFNQNLSVLAGGIFHKQKRLDGQYEEGQILNESLTPDQLAVEPYYINFFFAVAFRFGSNPFGSGE